MIVGGIVAVAGYCWQHRRVSLVFGLVAVLFNPIIAIYMSKDSWQVIDILTFWVFFIGPGYLWPSDNDMDMEE